jgi:hypothetical protein
VVLCTAEYLRRTVQYSVHSLQVLRVHVVSLRTLRVYILTYYLYMWYLVFLVNNKVKTMKHERLDRDIETIVNSKRIKSFSPNESSYHGERVTILQSNNNNCSVKHIPSEDETLIEMIRQSKAKSYDEIVNYCLSVHIPISRVLRLDLMRLVGASQEKKSFTESSSS